MADNPHSSAVATEALFKRLHEFWDIEKMTGSACGSYLRKAFPRYPGSLTRSAVMGLLARGRRIPEYQKLGWFEDRTPQGGTKPAAWGGDPKRKNVGPAREPLWEQRRNGTSAPLVPKKPRGYVFNPVGPIADKFAGKKQSRERKGDKSFNQRYSPLGNPVPAPKQKIEEAKTRLSTMDAAFAPTLKAVTLDGLQSNHCRWPVDQDGKTLFCGEDRVEGHRKPYCSKHVRM